MMMMRKMMMVMMMIDTNLGIYHVASEKPASSWGEGSVTLRSFPRLIQPATQLTQLLLHLSSEVCQHR